MQSRFVLLLYDVTVQRRGGKQVPVDILRVAHHRRLVFRHEPHPWCSQWVRSTTDFCIF